MRIALLEDDHEQAGLIVRRLTEAGHDCTHLDNGPEFLRRVLRDSFDLLMIDWMLPGMDGIEAMKKVRQSAKNFTPVIFITARDEEGDVVRALEAGADDYMAKPVRPRELLARVTALARRAAGGREQEELPDTAPYEFDLKGRTVTLADRKIDLTHREYDLALFMFRHCGSVVSRGHILETIWGMHGTDVNTRTVDTHISRLRKKLELTPANGWQLAAIYQHGYRLERVTADSG